MKHRVLLLIICFLPLLGSSQDKNLQYYYSNAKEAYKAKSYPKFYEMISEAHTLHPYHQGILYQLGLAAALTGRTEEALTELKKALLIDASFKLEGLTDFNAIKGTPGFRALLELQKEYQKPVIHSDTAFVLKDRALHTEGIDYDPVNRMFYLGSIHKRKIIKSTPQGDASDFCTESFDGMTSIFGIKVDSKRNMLWACSSPMPEMDNFDSAARSAVFQFDLATGKLIKKFQQQSWAKDGVFGDLALNARGSVYVSEGETNTIFTVNEKSGQLEPFFTSPNFWNIQGITFSDHDNYLFIADYVKGLFRLNTKTKELVEIKCTVEASLKGIDGLTYYHGSLIAIQNGVTPLRVMRYFLNSDLTQIIRSETLDRKHPAFNEPTMGALVDNIFYYVANSQWGGYQDDHQIKPNDQLQDIVILKTKLEP